MRGRIEEHERELEREDERLGLPHSAPVHLPGILDKYMGLSPEALHKLSADECGEGAVSLQQYAFFLQRHLNKLSARMRWAEESLKRVLTLKIGPSLEERRQMALKESTLGTQLEKVRVDCLVRLERAAFLVQRVDALAKSLLSLQASRRDK